MTTGYKKILLSDKEVAELKKQFSIKDNLILNAVMSIPVFLLFAVVAFFPFLPHPKYGYGGQMPNSFLDYLRMVGRNFKLVILFLLFLIILTTVIDFIRNRIDILFRFKRVGVFKIMSVNAGDNMKILRLNGGRKLKLKSSDENFDLIKQHDIVEVGFTVTKRLLNFKIVNNSQPLTSVLQYGG